MKGTKTAEMSIYVNQNDLKSIDEIQSGALFLSRKYSWATLLLLNIYLTRTEWNVSLTKNVLHLICFVC